MLKDRPVSRRKILGAVGQVGDGGCIDDLYAQDSLINKICIFHLVT